MIPGCHSVVASWDHGGAKRVCLFKRPQAFSCWGASDSPQTPYWRNNKQGLSLHQKPWVTKAGGRECGRHIL